MSLTKFIRKPKTTGRKDHKRLMERIECRECGLSYINLVPHIRRWHNMTGKEYLAKWGGDLQSIDLREIHRETILKTILKNPKINRHLLFLKNQQLRKICLQCSKEFSPKIFIRKDGYKRTADSGYKWREKKYCSRDCQKKGLIGVKKSREHREKLKLAWVRRRIQNVLV